ncbi:MAG: undecaprenyl-phosphate glucose phosphotransferase [Acidobacteria bacterium]|jgi:exopolysaccharide biosynthesis polyprenyl glycosylphosphotransferase|nr:undecaprenyl-phosphate glucose phosphotransferase [Acidobacteriota bacterium]
MIRKGREQLSRLFVGSDALAIAGAFFISFWLRFHSGLLRIPRGVPRFSTYLVVIPFLLFIHMVYFSYQGFYRFKLRRNRLDDLFLVMLNCAASAFTVLLLFSYFKSYRFIGFEVSHVFLAVYAPVAVLAIFLCRALMFRAFRHLALKRNGVSRVLIAGQGDLATMTAANLARYGHFGLEVSGFLATAPGEGVLGGYEELETVVKKHGITDLFVAMPLSEYPAIMRLIESGNNLLVDIHLVPDILQLASLKAGLEHIEGLPVINLGDIPLQGWSALSKRLFDLLVACLGLVLLLPFGALVALLLRLDSRGPVFYRQERLGLDGRLFRMIKFRTMVRDAEKRTGAIWSPQNDPRVTRVGRVLRKLSIDELPQLLNVLIGDMSLVGPRPERPELVERFKESIPRYMLRHRVKAGMTGWAQVHGLRGNTPLDKRIEFDIFYIQNWTFRLDLEIIFRTLLKFQFVDWNN